VTKLTRITTVLQTDCYSQFMQPFPSQLNLKRLDFREKQPTSNFIDSIDFTASSVYSRRFSAAIC